MAENEMCMQRFEGYTGGREKWNLQLLSINGQKLMSNLERSN
jgi:hypothetical protein